MRIWSRVGLRARNMAEPHVHVPCVPRAVGCLEKQTDQKRITDNAFYRGFILR